MNLARATWRPLITGFSKQGSPLLRAILSSFFLFFCSLSQAEGLGDVQFKADFYERDLQHNTIKGRGNVWLKKGKREIWADEIEVDFATKRSSANNNVHIREGDIDIWCSHASFSTDSDDAVLDNVTLVSGGMVITGNVVRRLDARRFEIEEGSYSNCNNDHIKDESVGKCSADWKMYGRHFSLTLESYAHVYDVLVYIKDLPMLYLPYFIAPVKTQRQSGLLMPSFNYTDNLGNGITLPYYLVLGPWHDLTISPTYHSKTGYHLGLNYRYLYSDSRYGEANIFLLQRRYSPDRSNPGPDDPSRSRTLGLFGEWAVDLRNFYFIGPRAHSRQILRLVSDPFFTFDYGADLKTGYDKASLRSQLSVTYPTDDAFLAGKIEHHQSLIIPKDTGVDRGSVTSLPAVLFSKTSSPFLKQLFAYELDSSFTNFYRPDPYDSVPDTLNPNANVGNNDTEHHDPVTGYHAGDYIRTGQRIQVEPRLVANVPMPSGFQFQPVLKAGALLYHFDLPYSQIVDREYAAFELPFSIRVSKNFETGIPGYEKLNHVIQPRFIYANSPYQGGAVDHPFFYNDPTRGLKNPRFDIYDQIIPYEYMRFELINRVRRRVGPTAERFIRFELSEQYNLKTASIDDDPRYSRRFGPIEILGEFAIWRFSAQVQGNYQLELTERNGEFIRENDVSASLEYRSPGPYSDVARVGNRVRINADDSLTEKTGFLAFYKSLPTFFDLEGGLEYSYKRGDLLGSRLSFNFASKPRSCWGLTFTFGQNDLKQKFVRFLFRLDFGQPSSKVSGT